jgi:hypothetical protein
LMLRLMLRLVGQHLMQSRRAGEQWGLSGASLPLLYRPCSLAPCPSLLAIAPLLPPLSPAVCSCCFVCRSASVRGAKHYTRTLSTSRLVDDIDMETRDRAHSLGRDVRPVPRKSLIDVIRKGWRHSAHPNPDALVRELYCGFNRLSCELPPIIEQTCLYLEQHGIYLALCPCTTCECIKHVLLHILLRSS